MKVGYARTSTKSQNLDRQIQLLKQEGAEKLFLEQVQGNIKDRPIFNEMIEFIRDGDIVMVTELDRLGRTNDFITQAMQSIQAKGATLEALNLPTFKGVEDANLRKLLTTLIIEIYKYQAESERVKIKERQAEGIRIAREKGRYKGKRQKYKQNDAKLLHAFDLYRNGETEMRIEELTGINRRTFRRYRERYNVTRA